MHKRLTWCWVEWIKIKHIPGSPSRATTWSADADSKWDRYGEIVRFGDGIEAPAALLCDGVISLPRNLIVGMVRQQWQFVEKGCISAWNCTFHHEECFGIARIRRTGIGWIDEDTIPITLYEHSNVDTRCPIRRNGKWVSRPPRQGLTM